MHLSRQIRPAQRLRKLLPQLSLVTRSALTRQLDLPPQQIIQQPHVRLDQHRQPSTAHHQIRLHQTQPKMLHHICDRHRRAPRHAHAAVNEHLPTCLTRLLDPGADRVQLVLERVDPVVAHTLDVEHLDPSFVLFDPEGARPLSRDALRTPAPLNGTGWSDVTSGTAHLRGRHERTFANGDDMRDAQRMEHIRIRSVVSAHPMSRSYPRGE